MAWNWEKGCEEDDAYKHGGTVYSPPAWRQDVLGLVVQWSRAEDKAERFKRRYGYEEEAVDLWYTLEARMVFDDEAKKSEFRRGYMEYLAKGQKVVDEIITDSLNRGIMEDKLPYLERIIARGYRSLAKEVHPDVADNPEEAERFKEEFQNLKVARLQLDAILKEVKDIL
jgi:hypothetical protein